MFKDRKLNRLKYWDYSLSGCYAVTICAKDRIEHFGNVIDGRMILNENRYIVKQCWYNLLNHYRDCKLDAIIIMPNHIHGIIKINNRGENGSISVGTGLKPVLTGLKPVKVGCKPTPTSVNIKQYSLSEIMRGFKTFSSREINKNNPNISFNWQRSFYDHIIRSEDDLGRFREYIRDNPIHWERDRNNPKNFMTSRQIL